jgi:FdhE protein
MDRSLARSVLRLVLLPELASHSAHLDASRPEGLWTRGECPDCGSPSVLAESRGLDQRRHWRCGICAGDWPGDRLRCPFCGESDHRRLSYRFIEGEHDRHRLALCESCGAALPVVSTLAPLSAPGLLVAELATAHLAALVETDPDAGPVHDR